MAQELRAVIGMRHKIENGNAMREVWDFFIVVSLVSLNKFCARRRKNLVTACGRVLNNSTISFASTSFAIWQISRICPCFFPFVVIVPFGLAFLKTLGFLNRGWTIRGNPKSFLGRDD